MKLESYLLRSFFLLIIGPLHLGRLITWLDHLGLLSLVQFRDCNQNSIILSSTEAVVRGYYLGQPPTG